MFEMIGFEWFLKILNSNLREFNKQSLLKDFNIWDD